MTDRRRQLWSNQGPFSALGIPPLSYGHVAKLDHFAGSGILPSFSTHFL